MNYQLTKGTAARTLLLLALSAAPMFAQGPLTGVAAGISAEAVSVIQYVAVLVVIGMAVWMYSSHNHGIVGKLVMGVLGLFIMLKPTTIVAWIQSL